MTGDTAHSMKEFDARAALPDQLEEYANRFAAAIADSRRVAVAFSGGVDSSVALALSIRAKGSDQVFAVLGVSPSLATVEREQAHQVAALMGVPLVEVATQEMQDPRYVANDRQRCYFCKHELYSRSWVEAVTVHGGDLLVNGDMADDLQRADRPGKRAASELGVRSPLADASMNKAAVRAVALALQLPVWDKPSSPCLASRIPRAVPVTIGRLRNVEIAEKGLRALGLRALRVRHRGGTGLIELGPEEYRQVHGSDTALREEVERCVRAAGFTEAVIAGEPLRRD